MVALRPLTAPMTARVPRSSSNPDSLAGAGELCHGTETVQRPSLGDDFAGDRAETPGGRAVESPSGGPDGDLELGAIGNDHLGRRRWRRSADVRGEIGQGDVCLVADPADDRDAVADDGAHDRLVVECPEVLERPAAAGQDRHRGSLLGQPGGRTLGRVALDLAERRDQAPWRRVALDLGRDQDDAGQRPAASQDVADVLPDGAGGAGDDSDRRRSCGKRPLAGRVEQALRGEPGLERLEPQGQVAEPRRLDRLDVELERSLRLEQVDPSVCHDAQAGLRLERRADALIAEPDALQLVALVLEREVGMPGR